MVKLLKEANLLGNNVPWIKEFRQKGEAVFEKSGLPDAKMENWKYTKPNMFFDNEFSLNSNDITSTKPDIQLPFDAYKICFVDGLFSPELSDFPPEAEVLPIIEAAMFNANFRLKADKMTKLEEHPFVALNNACFNEGVFVYIPKNCKIERPIVIINYVNGNNCQKMCNLRNMFVIEENSHIELLEYYCYHGDLKSCYFVNVVNEIILEKGAKFNHYKVQDDAFKALHIALTNVEAREESQYNSFCLQKGADLARNETLVSLLGENAHTEVNAAYIMNGWATIDTTTNIKHLVPNTTSSQLVKGVVDNQAKGIFQGKIHIAPNAVKTNGFQLHRALLLSNDAEVDVKPELEIFADDVKCSHGSACGQIDKEHLFYMRSRGIDEETAKKILINAYLQEVIAKVDNEKIAEWIKLLLKM